MANHYPAPVVWRQKIGAILSRPLFKPGRLRLHLLAAGLKVGAAPRPIEKPDLGRVKENILAVDFGQFKSQVISYLEPDLQPGYDSEETWDAMRWRIIEALEEEPL
jgi:hypothetical protein